MMRLSTFLAAIGVGAAFAASLSAQQAAFPFQLVVQDQNQNATTVATGSTLNLSTNAAGSKVTITIVATYQGLGVAKLAAPTLLGSSEFSVSGPTATTLNTGNPASLQVVFAPTSSAQATAQLSIPYTETIAAAAGGSGAPVVTNGVIAFSLVGATPQFLISYFVQGVQNVTQLADGGTLTFPATLVPGSSQVVVQIQNNGSAAGQISSIQVTGAAFLPTSVPLLPGSLNANSVLQFGLVYTPTQGGADTGTLKISFPDHTVTINLAGTGTAPGFVYQLLLNGQVTTITPNQTIAFTSGPGVAVPFTITVQNTGNGNGTITGQSLSGLGFAALDAQLFPQIVAPGGFVSFNYSFTPPQVGSFPGRLRIGNDSFVLSGAGTGPQLAYLFTTASAPAIVSIGGTVPFSPAQIGQTVPGTFTVQNSGTAPATVISIFIGAAKSAFTISGLQSLPVTLAPGDKTSFTITFAPILAGLNVGDLHIDSAVFNLAGSGNAPPPLSGFSFQGASGVSAPLQQPAIGITLQSPYAIDIIGTLTITQSPQGFSSDPSIQFSTGGGTVAFTIPANSTQAVFPNNTQSIRLQTGSVANTITITPTFATTGGFDLTPANPPKVQITVASGPPLLSNIAITQTSANGFVLQIAGVATSRTLTTLDFTFAAQSKFNIANTKVSVNLASVASNWFQSNNSTPFGGQFLVTVPFALTSTTAGLNTTLPAIQAVSVTATNEQGTSNAVTTQFQ